MNKFEFEGIHDIYGIWADLNTFPALPFTSWVNLASSLTSRSLQVPTWTGGGHNNIISSQGSGEYFRHGARHITHQHCSSQIGLLLRVVEN